MNKFGIILVWFITISACNSTKTITSNLDYEKILIGTWKYKEMRNEEGAIITSYEMVGHKIIASGPTIVFLPDKSYKKIFTSENIDAGYWNFNSNTMTIEYELYIDSTDWLGMSLIEKGEAIKHDNGNYYERIEDKVILIEREKLVIDELGRQVVFQKKK